MSRTTIQTQDQLSRHLEVEMVSKNCDAQLKAVLEEFACDRMFDENLIIFDETQLQNTIRSCYPNMDESTKVRLLIECKNCSLLCCISSGEYKFKHSADQAYFASGYIARVIKKEDAAIREIIVQHRDNPKFQMMWRFVAERLVNDTVFLEKLFEMLFPKNSFGKRTFNNVEPRLLLDQDPVVKSAAVSALKKLGFVVSPTRQVLPDVTPADKKMFKIIVSGYWGGHSGILGEALSDFGWRNAVVIGIDNSQSRYEKESVAYTFHYWRMGEHVPLCRTIMQRADLVIFHGGPFSSYCALPSWKLHNEGLIAIGFPNNKKVMLGVGYLDAEDLETQSKFQQEAGIPHRLDFTKADLDKNKNCVKEYIMSILKSGLMEKAAEIVHPSLSAAGLFARPSQQAVNLASQSRHVINIPV